ncbi:MAG: DUF1854 domain-containing protein [Clostridia bacterium]|nr:DUF1854 domain-containing protein [Clostridia bacterium]
MARYYIDKYTGHLERTDLYLVRLVKKDGSVIEDLEPRKLFPFSNSEMYITLLDKNEKEVGFVRKLDEIDEESRKVLLDCFKEYYMIPKISRLLECEDKFGVLKWTVDTDRGEITFQIRNRHSDIKKLYGTNRVIVRDSNDNRYEIPDVTALDSRSNHLLYSYL